MSITIEQAKALKHGDILIQKCFVMESVKGKLVRVCKDYSWKVNGKVKTWKRSPEKVKVPVKHGLYHYGYITENELDIFSLA